MPVFPSLYLPPSVSSSPLPLPRPSIHSPSLPSFKHLSLPTFLPPSLPPSSTSPYLGYLPPYYLPTYLSPFPSPFTSFVPPTHPSTHPPTCFYIYVHRFYSSLRHSYF